MLDFHAGIRLAQNSTSHGNVRANVLCFDVAASTWLRLLRRSLELDIFAAVLTGALTISYFGVIPTWLWLLSTVHDKSENWLECTLPTRYFPDPAVPAHLSKFLTPY